MVINTSSPLQTVCRAPCPENYWFHLFPVILPLWEFSQIFMRSSPFSLCRCLAGFLPQSRGKQKTAEGWGMCVCSRALCGCVTCVYIDGACLRLCVRVCVCACACICIYFTNLWLFLLLVFTFKMILTCCWQIVFVFSRSFCAYRDENLCPDSIRQEINEGFHFLRSFRRQDDGRSLSKGAQGCLQFSFWVLCTTKNKTGRKYSACSITLFKTQMLFSLFYFKKI